MSTCPVCTAEQPEGLLCHNDTTRLEQVLAEVPWLVEQLTITISKQAKIGGQAGKGAPARERNPINYGALIVADELGNTLTTWARDIGYVDTRVHQQSTKDANAYLLSNIALIRRHPAVEELLDEILDATSRARRAVDKPADRVFLGPCNGETPDDQGRMVTCLDDLYCRPNSTWATCRTCGSEHDVNERRTWLLDQAADRIVTPREAAHLIGNVGHIDVNATRIRNWINRKQLPTRLGPTDEKHFRLGDLLILLAEKQEKAAA